MAVVSVVSISSGISLRLGISRPLAKVTVSVSGIGVSVVSTVVTAISKSVSVTVSTAVVSVVSISSGISISLGFGISGPLAELTKSISAIAVVSRVAIGTGVQDCGI